MELRAGEKRSFSALVLASIVYEDHHKIVELFTRECGRISCIARHAVKSRKRFGGSLEPMQLVTAHLRTPRHSAEGVSQLWELESVELNDAFSHLRRSLPWIHAASFVVSSVRELLPEQVVDVPMFRSLGRWLLEIRNLPQNSELSDVWVLLWLEWLSRHLGHGALLDGPQHANLQWIQNVAQVEYFESGFSQKLVMAQKTKSNVKISTQIWSQVFGSWNELALPQLKCAEFFLASRSSF